MGAGDTAHAPARPPVGLDEKMHVPETSSESCRESSVSICISEFSLCENNSFMFFHSLHSLV